MYWTDENGDPIPGGMVYNFTPTPRLIDTLGRVYIDYHNRFYPDGPLGVFFPNFAVFDHAIPLDSLNELNPLLAQTLQPVPGIDSFTVAPGDFYTIQVPGTVDPGQYVVLRYEVMGSAGAIDYVQFQVSPSGSIPTLSEWGLIIFSILLLGWMAFMITRRRRRSQVTAM
jgi:hypothetical protein